MQGAPNLVVSATADPRVLVGVARLRPEGLLKKPADFADSRGWLEAQVGREDGAPK